MKPNTAIYLKKEKYTVYLPQMAHENYEFNDSNTVHHLVLIEGKEYYNWNTIHTVAYKKCHNQIIVKYTTDKGIWTMYLFFGLLFSFYEYVFAGICFIFHLCLYSVYSVISLHIILFVYT